MKKRLLSILLSLAMVLTMIPFATMTAFALPTQIESVNIMTIIGVEEGKKLDDISIILTNLDSIKSTTVTSIWDNTNKQSLKPTDTLQKNVEYAIYVVLEANNGYVFETKTEEEEIKADFEVTVPTGYTVGGEYVGDVFEGSVTQQELNANNANYASFYIATTLTEEDKPTVNWSKLAKGLAIGAGITAATVGTIHTVKAIKNYKAEKAAEEAERKAAEEEAKRIAELEAAKALVEASALMQNNLVAKKNGKIVVSYVKPELVGVVGYEIERATDKAFTKGVKTYNTEKTTYTNSKNLKKGTKYFYRVRAKIQLADGSIVYTDWSNVRSAKAKKTK